MRSSFSWCWTLKNPQLPEKTGTQMLERMLAHVAHLIKFPSKLLTIPQRESFTMFAFTCPLCSEKRSRCPLVPVAVSNCQLLVRGTKEHGVP